MGILTLSQGEKFLRELVNQYNDSEKVMNEAETRFHLIDLLIEKVFGWDKSVIKVENYEKNNGFTDYELGDPRSVIIEAKKEGIPFDIPVFDKSSKNIIDLPSLLMMNKELENAIKQVQKYGAQRGAVCVVATNGHQFVIFLPTNTNGKNPLDGNALVFTSLSDLLNNFNNAWNAISFAGIKERRVQHMLGSSILSIPSKFSSEIERYPRQLPKNELQNELSTLSQVIIQDYMMKSELEESFYTNCYCENGALSHYSLLSKNILVKRYDNLFQNDKNIISMPIKSKKIDNINPSLFASSISDRPIVLIGDVGIGKTSFMKNLVYSSAYKEFKEAIYIYIDLGTSATLTERSLRDFILDEIENQLNDKYDINIQKENFIHRALRDKIKIFDEGIFGKYKESNPNRYQEKLDEYIYNFLESKKDEYINKSLHLINKERRKQIILCIDNADQRSSDIQQQAYLVAQELSKLWSILTFISMRPQTFLNSKASGVMAAYPQHVFTISPPKISEVITKRLEFAKKIMTGEVRFSSDIHFSLENISNFIEIILNSLHESNGKNIYEFIENIMHGNVRKSLEFIVELIGSPGLDSEEILRIFKEDGSYILPLHEFTKYAILNNNFYYDSSNSLAMNLFDIKINNTPEEHFLACLLIAYILNQSDSDRDSETFISYVQIVSELQNYTFTEEQINNCIIICVNKKLLEKEDKLTFLENPESQNNLKNLNFRTTSIGAYHIKKWIGEFAYLDAMVFDTPILDESTKEEMRKHVHSIHMYDRYTRATLFKEYLIRSWNSLSKKPPYFDFNSILISQQFTFDRVNNYIRKKYPDSFNS